MNIAAGLPRLFLLLVLIISFHGFALKGAPLFPCPSILDDNVVFWKKTYTEYYSSQYILHDYENPLIIYEIIDVSGKSKRSKRRICRAKQKYYQNILKRIAMGDTSSSEAVRILKLWRTGTKKVDFLKAGKNMRVQAGQRDKYLAGLKRSGRYLGKIREIFKSFNLPERLIYLPHVESSFNYRAYSHKGAAGIWQFMRRTGRRFLKVNYLVDERFDPIASSVAAAKLLKHNYERLGTWPLAVTAYNYGANGMANAVKQLGTTDFSRIIRGYKGRRFRFASKNFYAAFLVVGDIAMNYKDFYGEVEFEPLLEYKEVVLDRYYSPGSICKALDISLSTLKAYNPALRAALFVRKRKIPKGFALKIPPDINTDIQAVLVAIPEKSAGSSESKPYYYKIGSGDCISTIAEEFSVPVEELLEANGLSRRSKIYAGQVLVIPGKGGSGAALKRKLALKNNKKYPETVTKTRVPAEENKTERKSKYQPILSGGADTASCSAIGNMALYSHTADKTGHQQTNVSASSNLAMEIFMPATAAPESSYVFNEEIYQLDVTVGHDGKYGIIKISFDETLSHYADWLLVPYRKILRMNGLKKGRSRITRGRKLRVPFLKRSVEKFKRQRLEFHMAIEEDFYAAYRVKGTTTYKVKRGDTMWELSDPENRPPFWLIKKYNPEIDIAALVPGQKIIIPEIEEVDNDR